MEAYIVDLSTVFQLLTWTSKEKSVGTTGKSVFNEISKISVKCRKLAPQEGNAKNPPLNRPSKYKPLGACA